MYYYSKKYHIIDLSNISVKVISLYYNYKYIMFEHCCII